MPPLATFIRYAASATLPLFAAGDAAAWTVSQASACDFASSYQ